MTRQSKGEAGRKESRSFGLSPWIIDRIEQSVNSGDYTGKSDIANTAFAEHFILEEQRKRDEKMFEIYQLILENVPPQEILNVVQVDRVARIDALKKKGVLCVELGDLVGAQECFNEVKELEIRSTKKQASDKNTEIVVVDGTIEDEDTEF
jgi:hypothetical protein